jgi:hypothetical protein
LGESFWGSHQYGDRRYFLVGVTDKDLVPKALYILDQDHGKTYGPYTLMPAPESHFCGNLVWAAEQWYQTDGIEPARWPADFSARFWGDSFVYQIELESGAGDQARIEISEPPGQCQGGTP